MRSRASNAGSVAEDAFCSPDKALEMATYDGLPARLQRALDNATRQFSALQAYQMFTEDDYTADEVAEIIEKVTAADRRRGHYEEE